MTNELVAGCLIAVGSYLGLGCLFAVPFVVRWVGRLDANAEHGTWGFRALIFPASVALWPLVAQRVLASPRVPVERSPHRDAAGGGS